MIPITITDKRTTDDNESKPAQESNRDYSRHISVQELREDIRCFLQIPSTETIKFKLLYGQTKVSNMTQKEVDDAFLAHEKDPNTKICIQVERDPFPSFPSAFGYVGYGGYGDGHKPKTLMELQMMKLSASIRRKPQWFEKMNNPTINAKWTQEAKAQGCSDRQISYVLKELNYYADLMHSGMQVSDIDCVWHSDTLIDDKLKMELVSGVALLENIPDKMKDWHPGSKEQVLDLVHPSLYPLTYGKTCKVAPGSAVIPSLKCLGSGEPIEFAPNAPAAEHDPNQEDTSISKKFSWLPSEFMIHESGEVTIDSYINNLHPKHHKRLYGTLAKIFTRFVPLFEKVLNDQLHIRPNRIQVDPFSWYGEEEYAGDSEDSNYSELYEAWVQNRTLNIPEPPEEFVPPPKLENPLSLLGSQVQVIVKLANIILTPEKPKYSGGVWHVEGMKNENIVATGIYYYDVENISESELGFRQNVCEPDYEQNDNRGVHAVYGLEDEAQLVQELGSVLTQENRCLAFPNLYQHQVAPFKLTDKTKPGHRKILVFFLINPGIRIHSTLTIPPQQLDWYIEELGKVPPFDGSVLPVEVFDYFCEYLQWPVSMKKAKKWREELMEERKYFISKNSEVMFQRPFSLCEH